MSQDDVFLYLLEKINYPSSSPSSSLVLDILRKIMTPEEAEFLLQLPGKIEELAKKLNMEKELLENKLQGLTQRGLVIKGRSSYFFPRGFVQLHDSTLSSSEEFIPPGVYDLWKDWYEAGGSNDIVNELVAAKPPIARVIPTWKSLDISNIPSEVLLPYEDVRQIMKGAELLAVVGCPCRRSMRRCKRPVNVCVQFNQTAELAINRRAGRKVSLEEIMTIVDEAEEAGLVHTVQNSTWVYHIMCNCCEDCCGIINSLIQSDRLSEGLAPSRFQAKIDQEPCTGCQVCVDRCPFNAIQMQKVPTSKKLKAYIEPKKCFGCGLCVFKCEQKAINLEIVRTKEHIPEITKPLW